MNNISHLKKITLVFLILILGLLVYNVSRLGLADFYATQSYKILKPWQLSPYEMEENTWDDIQQNLEKAYAYDPGNPELLMALGLAYEGRFADKNIGIEIAKANRERALDFYRKSVQLRPTWPYGWIDLALVKYRLDEIDDEYYRALHKAVESGPWEPGVQRVAIDIGLHGRFRFTQEANLMTFKLIANAVEHADKGHSRQVMDIVRKHGVLDIICVLHKDKQIVMDYCQQYQKK